MKIGLFYSYGPHFLKAIHFLTEKYPDDNILLFLPQNFPTYYFENLSITPIFLHWDGHHLSLLKGTLTFFNIIKIIRSQQLDQFVVLFESPRQITLCKLSGAKEKYIYSIHKEYKPITQGILKVITKLFMNRLKGFFLYSYIFFNVYLCKSSKKNSHFQ